MADPRELTTAELVARGLLPAGPLAPALTAKDPEKNLQTMRELVNPSFGRVPSPEIINPVNVLGKVHQATGTGLGKLVGALGGLNLGAGMMSPEQQALRSRQLGNQFRDMGEAMLMPVASAGRVIGPLAQEARPLFTAFLTRLGQQAGLAGTQAAMSGKDAGTIFGHAVVGATLQGAFEAPANIVRTLMASNAGQKILGTAAAAFQKTLESFQARQQFDAEFVGQLNELRAQGAKEAAAKVSAEYSLKAYNHKLEGQQMTADWERAVHTQEAAKALAQKTHSEQVAQNITQTWDQRVPAWQGLPQDLTGLVDRVYGQGQTRLQDSFKTSLKEIIDRSKGTPIVIPAASADALGISTLGGATSGTPAGRITNTMTGAPDMARVDAGDVAQALYGHKGEIDPDLYHSVVSKMIEAGLGNGQANAEYASGTALRQFLDKTQALEHIAQPTLSVEKMLKGLTKLPVLKQLQGRLPGEDALRGAIADARQGLPQPSPDIPKPVQAPLPPKPQAVVAPLPIKTDPRLAPENAPTPPTDAELGITRGEGPSLQKLATLGTLLGAGVGGQVGGGYGHYGVGGAAGSILGVLLSKLLSGPTVRGPISARAENVLAKAPTVTSGVLRAIYGGGELSPEQVAKMDAEIQAAKQEGRTAATDPRLSLEVDPVENR